METGLRLKVSSDRLVKPGTEPETPGLQGNWFIHYTTAAPTSRGVQECENPKESWSKEFGVGECIHQDSVLSLLLFIIVLEALSREFHNGYPWEVLYADVP